MKNRNASSCFMSSCFILLYLHHLFHAFGMPARRPRRRQKNLHDMPDLIFAEQVGAEAEDIAMDFLARQTSGDLIVRQRGADALDLVGGDGHPDAGAVEEDAD